MSGAYKLLGETSYWLQDLELNDYLKSPFSPFLASLVTVPPGDINNKLFCGRCFHLPPPNWGTCRGTPAGYQLATTGSLIPLVHMAGSQIITTLVPHAQTISIPYCVHNPGSIQLGEGDIIESSNTGTMAIIIPPLGS